MFFCRAVRPRVPKTILFFDELTPTVLGGCRDGISRGDVLGKSRQFRGVHFLEVFENQLFLGSYYMGALWDTALLGKISIFFPRKFDFGGDPLEWWYIFFSFVF